MKFVSHEVQHEQMMLLQVVASCGPSTSFKALPAVTKKPGKMLSSGCEWHSPIYDVMNRLVPNSRQPAAGRINRLLGLFLPATFAIF